MNVSTHGELVVRCNRPSRRGSLGLPLLLIGILSVALVLRVGFIFYLDPEKIYFNDTIVYNNAAQSLLSGHGFGFSYLRPPLYPLFLAAIQAFFPGNLVVVKLADALLGCVMVFLTYLVGKQIWGDAVGILGAAFVAVHPYLVVLGAFLYPETLFTVLLLISTLILLRARSAGSGFLAGVVGGVASLAKVSGLAILPAGGAWLLFFGPGSRRRRIAMAGLFVLGGVATTLPWLARNYLHLGDVSLVDARTMVHVTDREGAPPGIELERRAFVGEELRQKSVRRLDAGHVATQFVKFWSVRPEELATSRRDMRETVAARDQRMVVERHPAENMQRYSLLLVILLLPYYTCAVLGLWFGRARFQKGSLLLLLILCFAVGRALFYAKLRYRLPVEPDIALFAAAGAWGFWQALRSARRLRERSSVVRS